MGFAVFLSLVDSLWSLLPIKLRGSLNVWLQVIKPVMPCLFPRHSIYISFHTITRIFTRDYSQPFGASIRVTQWLEFNSRHKNPRSHPEICLRSLQEKRRAIRLTVKPLPDYLRNRKITKSIVHIRTTRNMDMDMIVGPNSPFYTGFIYPKVLAIKRPDIYSYVW